jgi:hypothetical protein
MSEVLHSVSIFASWLPAACMQRILNRVSSYEYRDASSN